MHNKIIVNNKMINAMQETNQGKIKVDKEKHKQNKLIQKIMVNTFYHFL